MTGIILKQILTMLVIMVVGAGCGKAGFISEKGNKELSNLLLMVINPAVVFLSFQRTFEANLWKNLLIVFIISVLSFAILIPINALLIPKKEKEYAVERISAIYSNCGYFGIPLVNAVLGSEGVFYLAAYMAIFNLVVWTHGVGVMKAGEKTALKEKMKNLCNINVIAIFLGIACFVLGIGLTPVLKNGIQYVADMNTPLAMLIAGFMISEAKVSEALKNIRVYYIAFLKLVAYPVFIILLLKWLPVDMIVKQVIAICCACPIAATVTMFSIRYDKNAVYASYLYVVTTICTVVTMPLVMMLL